MKPSLTLLFSLPFFFGCGGDALKEAFLLGELRVLSLSVDTPEVAPGAAVVITPLVSDVDGAGRALTYSAEACGDPGVDFGATATCEGRPDRVVLATDLALPLAAPNYTATAPTLNVTVPATILTGRSPLDQNNGVGYLVFYNVKAADGTSVKTLKRIFASTRATKNTNPTLTGIEVNAAAPAALPTALAKLTPVYADAAVETYVQLQTDGSSETKTEEMVTTWFVTDGKLEEDRTAVKEANEWTPPSTAPTGRNSLVIGVLRDRRGGETSFIVTY